MKYIVTIQSFSSLAKHISVRAACQVEKHELKSGLLCDLLLDSQKLIGSITSVNTKADRLTLTLQFTSNIETLTALYTAQGMAKEVPIFTEELKPQAQIDEAQKLLYAYSHMTGKTTAEILLSLTAFKPGIEGRDDLRFISKKQLDVVISKLKQLLESGKL